jgi:hypothetical protein
LSLAMASQIIINYINLIFGLYVAYGLVQVNLKTEDKTCGQLLLIYTTMFLTVTLNVSTQTPPSVSTVSAGPRMLKVSKSSLNQQISENNTNELV